MANTSKQRRNIEQSLFSRFTHPSPSLKKKWERRRAIMGAGQDVLDLEYAEWMSNENQEVIDLMDNYQKRLAEELWNKKGFKQEVVKAREVYLNNIALPPQQQDYECLWRLNQKVMDKYSLNNGWLSWLTNCIKTNENDPQKIFLYQVGGKGPKTQDLFLNVYFPLPDPVYQEAILDLRMAEREKFGDYYSQEQKGGRPKNLRTQETTRKYRRMINLRNSAQWRMKTDKEFLDHFPEYSRSGLTRAKKWEKEGKPR
jgi:hypothetical protein